MSDWKAQTYTTVLLDGRTVGYYMDMLPSAGAEQDYMSVTIPAEDRDSARELVRRGFVFADRSITIEIPLKGFRPIIAPGRNFCLSVKKDWDPEDVYAVACGSFETDRRFVLDIEQCDAKLKNELLQRYIRDRKDRGDTATCLYRDGKLAGFNLWRILEGSGCVTLGAVSVHFRSTGIAFPLYSHTLWAMREEGAEELKDRVACSNMASLNLHAMLIRCAGGGFRFGSCRDHYMKERRCRICGTDRERGQ